MFMFHNFFALLAKIAHVSRLTERGGKGGQLPLGP